MKKTLLGTTALIAASLAILSPTTASAQAPAQGFKSANFDVTLGGWSRQFISYSQIDKAGLTVGDGFNQETDTRFWFNFAANVPGGMRALANLTIDPHRNSATSTIIRRSWTALEGGFGRVQAGIVENSMNQLFVGSYDAFSLGTVKNDGTGLGFTTAGSATTIATTGGDQDGVANKALYFTPRISGFQGAVHWTPDETRDRRGVTTEGVQYRNGRGIAVNFIQTFSGVGVRAYGAYHEWDKLSEVNMPDATRLANKKPSQWGAGLGFQYMGFDLGGSYANLRNYRNFNNGGTSQVASTITALTSLRTIDGYAFEAGLGYKTGPIGVSLNYFYSENDNASFTAAGVETPQAFGKDKREGVAIAGAYTLAPGVNVEATVFNYKLTDGSAADAAGNFNGQRETTTNGVITGLVLSF